MSISSSRTWAPTAEFGRIQVHQRHRFRFHYQQCGEDPRAGDYVLVVKNIAAFTSRYGARTNIAGEFAENLDNSGEHITLVGAAMETILDFVYNDVLVSLSDGSWLFAGARG